jgi:cytochrome c oxidase assembly factor CtaG
MGTALFSAHMLQHLLLVIIAAPLLVLGAPLLPLIWAFPKPARQGLGRWWRQASLVRSLWQTLSQPVLVWLLYAFTLWIWHLPALYQAALEQVLIHELEHLTFFGTALLFWWLLIQPIGHRRMSYGAGVLFVFTTALHSGALGALITFAQRPLYPIYVARAWNTTALEDQQLAGLVMWIPMGIIYLITALALLALWLHTTEQRVRRREEASVRRLSYKEF